MRNKLSKRDFLKNLLAVSTVVTSSRASAISILEHLKTNQPNEFEKELINNPQKQILIAEKVICFAPGYQGYPSKAKCITAY